MEVEVKSLTHEDIANILEVATYGNSDIYIMKPKKFKNLIRQESEFGCDKWADIILGGGYVHVYDMYAEAEGIEDAHNKDLAIKYDATDMSIAYKLDLQALLKACSNNIELAQASISGEGDLSDAYDLIQYAIFGDIIYG